MPQVREGLRGGGEHCRFFLLRSPGRKLTGGLVPREIWLIPSIAALDVDEDLVVCDSVTVAMAFEGAITLRDLWEMPADLYLDLVKAAEKRLKKNAG